jgi:hypothetical protein
MPRQVVAMGVRNERPGLAAAKVNRQVGGGQFQAVIPMKQRLYAPVFRIGLGRGIQDPRHFLPLL